MDKFSEMRRKMKWSSFIFPQMTNISHEKKSSWRWAVQAVISVKADNKIRQGKAKVVKKLKGCLCLGEERKKRWIEVMNQVDKFLALLSSCLWTDILQGSLNLCMKRLNVTGSSSLSVSPLCKWKKQAPCMFSANFCQLSEHVEKTDCGLGRQVQGLASSFSWK